MKKHLLVFMLFLFAAFSATLSAEAEFDLERYSGKVVYVDFWASWCTPCRASFPFMQAMADQYGQQLAIIAINVDESRIDADRFLKQFEINFDIVYDTKGEIARLFDLKGMPTSYLFGREGQLIGSHVGFRKKDIDALEAAISEAVKK